MAFSFEEKRKYQKLVNACKAYPPDWDKIRAMLESGIDLNVKSPNDDEENLLSEIFLGYLYYSNANGAISVHCRSWRWLVLLIKNTRSTW